MKDHNCFKILDLVASIAAFHWSICIKYAVHWRKSKLAELNPKVWNCQAQVQSQIQVPNPSLNPSPKSKIQSPEKKDWDWGWHYNPTGHRHQHPPTPNFSHLKCQSSDGKRLSMTFHDLPWPSMTFYHLLRPLWPSKIKCLLLRPILISGPL